MANPNAMHEPSMEEILASIRQIISEDGGSGAPKIDGVRAEHVAPERPEPVAESVAYDEAALAEPEPESTIMTMEIEPEPSQSIYEAPPPRTYEAPRERHQSFTPTRSVAVRTPQRQSEPPPLLSEETGSAVSGAFGALAQSLLSNNARSLEQVVTEMLQPMLKQWLDDNLPSIVERKVQEEIERVSRGRR